MSAKLHMIDQLIFFNVGGNGDLHMSREFCRHIIDNTKLPIKYAHIQSKDVLKDLQCEHIHLDQMITFLYEQNILQTSNPQAYFAVSYEPFFLVDKTLLINTYIGQQNYKYVADAKTPWFQRHYQMWLEIYICLLKFDINISLKDMQCYLPNINFNRCVTDRFMHLNKMNILISNGRTNSFQSCNFDFDPILKNLAKKYPFCNFYVTAPTQVDEYNIIDVNKIYNFGNNSNLNEIAYLSTFCDIVVGRSTGTDVVTLVKQNVENPKKTYICFCSEREMADPFCDATINPKLRHKIVWHHADTNTIENNDLRAHVIDVIENEIKLRYFDKFIAVQ